MLVHKKNYSLQSHNTFGISACTSEFLEYTNVPNLKDALRYIKQLDAKTPLLIIGGGSNILFTKDFDGVVLHSQIKGIDEISFSSDEVTLRVGSGEVWDDFVDYCVDTNYSGAENLSLIPGEVGASAVQNIGAYGVEAKDLIFRVEAIEISSGQERIFENSECLYGYRNSIFKGELKGKYIITHVQFRLKKEFKPQLEYGNIREKLIQEVGIDNVTLQNVRETIIKIRDEKLPDPKVNGNAGSFFMNPVVSDDLFQTILSRHPSMPYYKVDENRIKIPAGWLIDQCGWKGKKKGRAAVHANQALVLINGGDATGADIIALSEEIQADVMTHFGISLTPEVIFI